MTPTRLIVGDAVAGLRTLPDGCADVVLTDPPFSSGATREAGKCRASMTRTDQRWFGSDNLSTRGICALLRDVAVESFRILRPGGHLFAFVDWRMLPDFGDAIESADLRRASVLVWDKRSPGMGNTFRKRHEFVLHFTRGAPAEPLARDVPDVLAFARVAPGSRVHPTEKPVDLLRAILRPTLPAGGLVVDPFAGSGATGEAAVAAGGRACLIERDQFFAGVIVERLRLDPFAGDVVDLAAP